MAEVDGHGPVRALQVLLVWAGGQTEGNPSVRQNSREIKPDGVLRSLIQAQGAEIILSYPVEHIIGKPGEALHS